MAIKQQPTISFPSSFGLINHHGTHHFTTPLKPYSAAPKGTTIRLKTGSLNIARCLAGYIDTAPNQRYAFCILLDRGTAKSIGWASQLRYDI